MEKLMAVISLMTTRKKPTSPETSIDRSTICRILWGWPGCSICEAQNKLNRNCTNSGCPGTRLNSLQCFFQHYQETAASYIPELLPGVPPALASHEDLLRLISHIKQHPTLTREELARSFFSVQLGSHGRGPTEADQGRALCTALKAMSMVDCSGLEHVGTEPLTRGISQASSWGPTDSYKNLWTSIFPTKACPELNTSPTSSIIMSNLSARKLVKTGGLKLQGTNDLRNHLGLDTKSGILEIYHFTSVLKEHLYETRDRPDAWGNIPRELALETLATTYNILFPFGDIGSQSILRKLIRKEGFDTDCRRSASTAYRRPEEDQAAFNFKYWGTRLMDLYDEVDDPTPRGYLERWFQRKSGARYVMMATLVGVGIAIILGIFGLAVGIFQAWVAYQQWQHRVSA
ncbi:hypothetical protein QBC34DRAFT_415019 [Podospora aff. communis PSN243]|uniref:Uncharacterized protein n=1 Tax=Podospora aff. communis PSN243 TaxID=3040156 RepID=A0AAV9GAQ6_9PEZI|nr:hypothetical protein QBC34DRAFT_415019 [Podospora aff. communis PSN243]